MSNNCLKCLNGAIEAAEIEVDAYLFKTRTQRLIHLTRNAYLPSHGSYSDVSKIVDQIEKKIDVLGQPSEPVQVALQPVWTSMKALLIELRSILLKLD